MTDRRQFLIALASAASAASLPSCAGGGVTDSTGGLVSGTRRLPLMAVGESVAIANFGPGGQGVAVTRLTVATFVAVSRQCTHAGCTVGLPAGPGTNLNCPCHGSQFTTQGAVVNGPAASPLASFAATLDNATSEVVVTVS